MNRYHQQLLGLYGTYRRIPLRELVHPVTGLGLPEFAPKPYAPTFPPSPQRDALLSELLQRCDGHEVELTDTDIDQLDWRHTASPRASADLHLWPITTSPQHLTAGDYQLAVVARGPPTTEYARYSRPQCRISIIAGWLPTTVARVS